MSDESEVTGPGRRMAFEIPGGRVVIRATEDGHRVCLKLDRIGKEYLHHYVVVLEPLSDGAMQLDYVDPEEELFDCEAEIELDYGEASGEAPDVGHAFSNPAGRFIKVMDDPHTQKLYGFVEPASGLVQRRQERKLEQVFPNWKARARVKDELLELAELLERFAAEL